jgi:Tfp pilus assembly protein PilF
MKMDRQMRDLPNLRNAKRWVLTLFVCVGLCIAAPKGYATPQQEQSSPAMAAAEQAYREVEAKDYIAAVRDFRKALASDPTNMDWQNDLAYASLSAGAIEDAATEFERALTVDPKNFSAALQLGYIFEQLHRTGAATKYLEIAARGPDETLSGQARAALADLRTTDLQGRKQKGYDLLAANHTAEAIQTFESVHTDDPSDATATLQLAYLYSAEGNSDKAEVLFTEASASPDPAISAPAKAALQQVHHETKRWFASIYAEPFFQSRFSNEVNPTNLKIGLQPSRYFQPYVGLRFSRDIRSRSGTLPQIYSDNSAVFSVGVQSPIAHTGAVVYAEAGTAVSLVGTGPEAPADYRVGLLWFHSWGASLVRSPNASGAARWMGSAYADGGYYSRYNRNAIGSAQLREGIRLATSRVPMALLGALNLVKDSNGNFYNNVMEVGPMLRVAPLRSAPSLAFEATYVRGFYTVHDPVNPYGPRYGDFRLSLVWSKDF